MGVVSLTIVGETNSLKNLVKGTRGEVRQGEMVPQVTGLIKCLHQIVEQYLTLVLTSIFREIPFMGRLLSN